MAKLKITQDSISNELKGYEQEFYKSICEYIWNSFDAGASRVDIDFTIPEFGSIEEFTIKDNGSGWDFDSHNTEYFMASDKKNQHAKHLTLPHGKWGRGRYAFIWHASKLVARSGNKELTLTPNALYKVDKTDKELLGTSVSLVGLNEKFTSSVKDVDALKRFLSKEFCWFLEENKNFSININKEKLNYEHLVRERIELKSADISTDIRTILSDLKINIVLWKSKPSQYAKFYIINSENKKEILTEYTSLNKKRDDFWHSVYIQSKFFKEETTLNTDNEELNTSLFENDEIRKAYKDLVEELKEKLLNLRKPVLEKNADRLIETLKEEKAVPNLQEFGIEEDDQYFDFVRQVYITAPHLFAGKGKDQKLYVTSSLAALISTHNSQLLTLVLAQITELSDEEKNKLKDLLERTNLSSIVNTVAEIDDRLQAIDDLEGLLFDKKYETLEVKHLQKVLNNNVWLLGEEYRLFADTEGALKNTLFKYAKNILNINEPDIKSKSRGEVDLFLTKTLETDEKTKKNLIVEIKRPSVKLSEKEFGQIKKYARDIVKEDVCNGDNIIWDFYLIGNDYNQDVKEYINNAENYGERRKGLAFVFKENDAKIYVRKWSDIINVENRHKIKYLKDKLNIQKAEVDTTSSEEIVKRHEA